MSREGTERDGAKHLPVLEEAASIKSCWEGWKMLVVTRKF